MAQWIKTLATKPNDHNLIPGAQIVKAESSYPLTSTCTLQYMCLHTRMHTHVRTHTRTQRIHILTCTQNEEDQGLTPSTHVIGSPHVTLIPWDQIPSSGPKGIQTCAHIQRDKHTDA